MSGSDSGAVLESDPGEVNNRGAIAIPGKVVEGSRDIVKCKLIFFCPLVEGRVPGGRVVNQV